MKMFNFGNLALLLVETGEGDNCPYGLTNSVGHFFLLGGNA